MIFCHKISLKSSEKFGSEFDGGGSAKALKMILLQLKISSIHCCIRQSCIKYMDGSVPCFRDVLPTETRTSSHCIGNESIVSV